MSATLSPELTDASKVVLDRDNPPHEAIREKEDRRKKFPPLLKYLSDTLDTVIGLDKSERERATNQMARCVAYFDGRQDGQVVGGEWRDNEPITGEILAKDNQYFVQVSKLFMEMCRANIELDVIPTDDSDHEMKEAAKFYAHRLQINRTRPKVGITRSFIQRENISLLLKTTAYRYVYFDPNGDCEGTVSKPSYKEEVRGEEKRVVVCRTCGVPQSERRVSSPVDSERKGQLEAKAATEVVSDEIRLETAKAAPCENCGDIESREIALKPSQGMDIDYEELPAGHVVTRAPDASMVQLSMAARGIDSSKFLRWRLVLMRCDWEEMFLGKKIPSTEQSTEARYAESSEGRSANSSWNDIEAGNEERGGSQFEKIGGDIVWLDPSIYRDYWNREDEKLPNGQTLPKDTPLIKDFPDGMCVIRVGKTVLNYVPSNKNKQWMMTVYGTREHALYGSGTNSLLGPQDNINDELSFIKANNLYNAAGREFIRAGAFSNDQLPSIDKVGIVTEDYMGEKIVGGAYDRSSPSGLDAGVYGFLESQRGSLQEHAGTSSLSAQGAADMKALGTATGVEASRDQAVARMIPNLDLKAGIEEEWGYCVGELEKENYPMEMFLSRAGKANEKGEVKFTERGVRAFFSSNIRRDFRVKAKEGSWMPNTPQQDRANAAGFAEAAAKIQNPEILSEVANKFGMSLDLDEFGATRRVASLRLKEYARVASVIEEAGFPPSDQLAEVVLAQSPLWAQVNPEMDHHVAFMDVYSDWFSSDEGLNASDLLRMAVQKAHELHRNKGIVHQAQEEAGVQLAVKAPEMAAQEQMVNQQKEQEAAQMTEAEDAAKTEMIEHEIGQQALKEKDREHASQVKMAEVEHAAMIDVMKQEASDAGKRETEREAG